MSQHLQVEYVHIQFSVSYVTTSAGGICPHSVQCFLCHNICRWNTSTFSSVILMSQHLHMEYIDIQFSDSNVTTSVRGIRPHSVQCFLCHNICRWNISTFSSVILMSQHLHVEYVHIQFSVSYVTTSAGGIYPHSVQ